jgi:hypothetical protein
LIETTKLNIRNAQINQRHHLDDIGEGFLCLPPLWGSPERCGVGDIIKWLQYVNFAYQPIGPRTRTRSSANGGLEMEFIFTDEQNSERRADIAEWIWGQIT